MPVFPGPVRSGPVPVLRRPWVWSVRFGYHEETIPVMSPVNLLWDPPETEVGDPALRLFCLPPLGADAPAFQNWSELMDPRIEVVAGRLPGRQAEQLAAPAVPFAQRVTEQLVETTMQRAGDAPYALFGHGTGALLAYDLARALVQFGKPPTHLLVSGQAAPHTGRATDAAHRSSVDPPLPGLQDLQVLRPGTADGETRDAADRLLDIDLEVLCGADDPGLDTAELGRWADLTTGRTTVRLFSGGHCYLFEQPSYVVATVASVLSGARENAVPRRPPRSSAHLPRPSALDQALHLPRTEASPLHTDTAAQPVFGEAFTAHMVTALWNEEEGWHPPVLSPRRPLLIDPAMVGLHYGQAVFEGLKAHRQVDGTIALFRPDAHARRMRASARRLAMPEPPEELFLQAAMELVQRDRDWLPKDPSLSLYLRPLLVATEPCLSFRPSRSYLFLLLAFVTGGFFADQLDPIAVQTADGYTRAVPGGTGAAKYSGNYAPTYLAQASAAEAGCQQVVWLDAVERKWVEEMSAMNLFFVRSSGDEQAITTPPLTGTLLAGITRDSLLTLAPTLGYQARQEPISVDEWRDGCLGGTLTETFACGTAAIVTPVGEVRAGAHAWKIGNGVAGPVTLALRTALRDIQRGTAPDRFGWMHPVDPL